MTETISNSVMNGNTVNLLIVSVLVFFLVLIFLYCLKSKLITIGTQKIKVGSDGNDLTIVRRQIEYSKSELDIYFEEMIKQYSKHDWFVKDRCLMCKELVYDVIVEAIALNHITKDEFYCKGKMIKVWAELSKQPLSETFTSDEFKAECQKEITKIIHNLVDIRKYYSKQETI